MANQTVIYKKEKALIPNSQLEQMFLLICSDSQMQEYTKLIENGHIAIASAYASHRVTKTFMFFRDEFIKNGGDLDYLQFKLYPKK